MRNNHFKIHFSTTLRQLLTKHNYGFKTLKQLFGPLYHACTHSTWLGITYMIQVNEYANLHFDNEKDIHTDFESDKTNGYSHILKLLIILL